MQEEFERRRKLLVDALRGGEYEQINGTLHKPEGFCCLGVACDIYRKETGEGEWKKYKEEAPNHKFMIGNEYQVHFLPKSVMNWFGFKNENGAFKTQYHGSSSLSEENDRRATFEELAELIESNPEGMFHEK